MVTAHQLIIGRQCVVKGVRVRTYISIGNLLLDVQSPRPRNDRPEIDNGIKRKRLHLWHLLLARWRRPHIVVR